jgi:excisionase family DNA binding protein
MNNSGFYRQRNAADSSPPLSLRPREAAATLGISCSTLERLTKSGVIPVVKLGRVRLYEVDTLRDVLKSQTSKGGLV